MRVCSSVSKGGKLVYIFSPAFSKKSSIAAATDREYNTSAKKYGIYDIIKALCFRGPVLPNKKFISVNFATSVSLQV